MFLFCFYFSLLRRHYRLYKCPELRYVFNQFFPLNTSFRQFCYKNMQEMFISVKWNSLFLDIFDLEFLIFYITLCMFETGKPFRPIYLGHGESRSTESSRLSYDSWDNGFSIILFLTVFDNGAMDVENSRMIFKSNRLVLCACCWKQR
jgi:hypothetical protein